MILFKNLIFFRKFFDVSKLSPFNFFNILQQTGLSKSPKGPFYNFRHCEIFQKRFFVLMFSFFSGPARYIRFFKTVVFSMRLCSNLFLSKPPRLLLETKPFASLRVFGSMRHFPKEIFFPKKMFLLPVGCDQKVCFRVCVIEHKLKILFWKIELNLAVAPIFCP